MMEDHDSWFIEHAYQRWLASDKNKEHAILLSSPIDYLDFEKMMQYHIDDNTKQRPLKRGEAGERSSRPSDERFGFR